MIQKLRELWCWFQDLDGLDGGLVILTVMMVAFIVVGVCVRLTR